MRAPNRLDGPLPAPLVVHGGSHLLSRSGPAEKSIVSGIFFDDDKASERVTNEEKVKKVARILQGPRRLYYLLEGHTPVPCGREVWARMLDDSNRVVAQTPQKGERPWVSTVFLGLDHSRGDTDDPLLFETVIFGGEHGGWEERCSTWDEAEATHAKACKLAGIPWKKP